LEVRRPKSEVGNLQRAVGKKESEDGRPKTEVGREVRSERRVSFLNAHFLIKYFRIFICSTPFIVFLNFSSAVITSLG
jgi:hypothetical protein